MREKGATRFHVRERVNAIGMYLGAQEGILPGAHFDIVLPGDGIAHGGAGKASRGWNGFV
jgi:hypothetical protein